MESKKVLFVCLLIFLMGVHLVSFSTKGAYLDHFTRSGIEYAEEHVSEVTRGLEGVLAMDVIMFITLLISIFFVIKQHSLLKMIGILYAVQLFIWFILGIIFLAGNDELGRKTAKDYYDSDNKSLYPSSTKSFVAAWVYQVIEILVGIPMGIIAIILMIKETK